MITMPRLSRGLSRKSAQRIHEAIEKSGYSKAELARRLGVQPTLLDGISGLKARTQEDVHRPVPGADIMGDLSIITNTDIHYLLGNTNVISPVVEKYKRQINGFLDSFAEELLNHSVMRLATEGRDVSLFDVLNWLRETGGEVGMGADIEQHFDLVKIPGPLDNFAEPLRVGSQSLAGRLLKSTDKELFRQQIQSWPLKTQQELASHYRRISDPAMGESFSITEMSVTVPGREQPIFYWSFKARVKLLGPDAPAAAICFAFE